MKIISLDRIFALFHRIFGGLNHENCADVQLTGLIFWGRSAAHDTLQGFSFYIHVSSHSPEDFKQGFVSVGQSQNL